MHNKQQTGEDDEDDDDNSVPGGQYAGTWCIYVRARTAAATGRFINTHTHCRCTRSAMKYTSVINRRGGRREAAATVKPELGGRTPDRVNFLQSTIDKIMSKVIINGL